MADVRIDFEIGANISGLNKQVRKVGADLDKVSNVIKTVSAQMNSIAAKNGASKEFEAAAKYAEKMAKYVDKVANQKTPVTLAQQARIAGGINQMSSMYKNAAGYVVDEPKRAAAEAAKAAREAARLTAEQERAARAAEGLSPGIVRARYALYDVANEARRTALLMGGLSVLAVKAASDFEKAFSDVKRTSGAAGQELENLKQSLIDISQTTPIAFADISRIATLGAQMGIAASGLDEFAATVAKFSAVTNVPVENVSTAIGRIGQLLDVGAGQYEDLASAILYTGRNSIATEEQILSLSSQIAASANQAGFAADQVIGLSATLASLGIAPEQARGVLLRLFADFDRVVAENGQTLRNYASLMGGTSETIGMLWKNDPAKFFTQFTGALAAAEKTSIGATGALEALGIVETREINVLQRLSSEQELFTGLLKDAETAYRTGGDLADQYGQKMETLDSKLQRLNNNIMLAAAAMGTVAGEILKPVIDALSQLLKGFTDNPIAATLGVIAVSLTAGVAVWLMYKAAVAQGMASIMALRVAMFELGRGSEALKISLSGLIAELRMLDTGLSMAAVKSRVAAAGLTTFGGAVATAKASLASMAPMLVQNVALLTAFVAASKLSDTAGEGSAEGIKKMKEQLAQFSVEARSAKDAIDFLASGRSNIISIESLFGQSSLEQNLGAIRSLGNQFTDAIFGMFTDNTTLKLAKQEIAEFDKAIATLYATGKQNEANSAFNEFQKQAEGMGYSVEEIRALLPSFYSTVEEGATGVNSLSDAQLAATETAEGFAAAVKTRLISALTELTGKQSTFASSLESFMTALAESKGSFSVFSSAGRKAVNAFNDFTDAVVEISGNDTSKAFQIIAASINLVEQSGGNASVQVQGLVTRLNAMFNLKLDGSTITSMSQLTGIIANLGGVTEATRAQILSLVSGGGYADAMKAAFKEIQSSIGKTTSSVKKQIRTINDYASDIGRVLGNITDLAFKLTRAEDGMSSGWEDIKNRISDAKREVEDLANEIADLEADRGTLQYQLGIAEKYGDTVRAAKIRAQLAKLDKQMTKANEDKQAAIAKTATSLTEETQAGIENREAIMQQVEASAQLIEAYATTANASGKLPTKAEVAAYAKTVVDKFTEQAKAIGFSAEELTKYEKIISGFARAVSAVEKPNVEVKLNPVDTAIKAYLAEEKETKVNLNVGVKMPNLDGIFQKYFGNLGQIVIPTTIAPPTANSVKAMRDSYKPGDAMYAYLDKIYRESLLFGSSYSFSGKVNTFIPGVSSLKMLQKADGGYIKGPGSGTSDSIPAMLSNGEYIVKSAAVNRYGIGFLNAINQMKLSPSMGAAPQVSAGGSSVVYLSPEDRALLRAAVDRPINLYTENTKIAQSANAGNVVLAQRGSN